MVKQNLSGAKRRSGSAGIWGAGERGSMECTPKMRQAIKGPATLNGGEQCWCPDKNIPVN